MADETTGSPASQADDGNQPQAGDTNAPQSSRADNESETVSMEEARKLRSENRQLRGRAKTAEDELETLKHQGLTELEKAQKKAADSEKENETLREKHRSMTTRYAVMIAAGKMGIVDPDAAVKLLDASALTYNDDGEPTNAETLLKEMVKTRTWLLGTQGNSSAGKPATKAGGITREELGRMAASDVARLDPAVVRDALAQR